MSIWDIFTSKANPATATAIVTQPADTSKTNPTVPGDGTVKPDGTGPGAFPKPGEGKESPLEGYKALWETDPNAKPVLTSPTINADPAALMKAAQGIDFTKVIPPELLEAAAKGDAVALGKVVNLSAQAGYAQSAHATAAIVRGALAEQTRINRDVLLPDALRAANLSSSLVLDNPIFSNPAVKPLVDLITTQVRTKYPTASEFDQKKHVIELFNQFSQESLKSQGFTVLPKGSELTSPAGAGANKEEDWGPFFGEPASPGQ